MKINRDALISTAGAAGFVVFTMLVSMAMLLEALVTEVSGHYVSGRFLLLTFLLPVLNGSLAGGLVWGIGRVLWPEETAPQGTLPETVK